MLLCISECQVRGGYVSRIKESKFPEMSTLDGGR